MDMSNILLVRFTSDGQLDRTFNELGYKYFTKTTLDWPFGMTLQEDGRVLILADIFGEGNGLIRYRGDEVVEFYNSASRHYFMTVDPAEQASIALGGSGPGWTVTGDTFKSNARTRVCRFSGVPNVGPNSHFYTLDSYECERVKQDPGWRFEGYDFSATAFDAEGQCAAGSDPVYRAYNNGFLTNDSNHRYTVNPATYASMIAEGWIGEGVVFCVPR